jgi:hypothetical protein
MRLFISYARVDKPFCQQIVDTLDAHEVWYDHRIAAGQKWWEVILKKLDWCEGFVYLLSKESVVSEYCKQEFAIAQKLGKHIFPVLIHPQTPIPDVLKEIQYADFSNGIDVKAVKHLLSALYLAGKIDTEAESQTKSLPSLRSILDQSAKPPSVDSGRVIEEAADALDQGDFDRAVYLLKSALESGYKLKTVNVEEFLKEAEEALERQSYLREAEREYRPIVALVKRQRTFHLGCKAFKEFRRMFPDYDPENLKNICQSNDLPLFEWCSIPAGEVLIERDKKRIMHYVDDFRMSRYPVTNAQFMAFINAADGYKNEKWWNFSPEACEWFQSHREPLDPKWAGDDYPRVNVCWYEAMAFCQWLSDKTGSKVTLPTEYQWQRAAQGDDGRRFPWGNKFEKAYCNTSEAGLKSTTPVNKYPEGSSPYGVVDLAGNTWEWCLTKGPADPVTTSAPAPSTKPKYIVRGGSFLGGQDRARNSFYFKLDPMYRYFTIGFRVVTTSR